MHARAFWKAVTVDRSNLLDRFFERLEARHVAFCLIGGQALNAYVEPVVSLDLDVVVGSGGLANIEAILGDSFELQPFSHRLNVSDRDSDLRIQIQRDPRYAPFVDRATVRDVLGLSLPVAAIEDILQGKLWAAQDTDRRRSKRQKDLADIARIVEAYPRLRSMIPAEVLARLV